MNDDTVEKGETGRKKEKGVERTIGAVTGMRIW